MKRLLFALSLVSSIIVGGCLADIRPPAVKENGLVNQAEIDGRALLKKVEKLYGGREAFLLKTSVNAIASDRWPGLLPRTFFMPWYKNDQKFNLKWLITTDNARLEFIEEPHRGEVWGIQNWATYIQKAGSEKPVFRQDDDIKFWLPTLEYFIEAPFRLSQAQIVQYAGEKIVNQKVYQLVFISWGEPGPQKTIDQYLVYINKATGLVDYLTYTVRDMMPFITGIMHYSNHKIIDGILVPHLLTVVNDFNDHDVLHEMTIHSLEFDKKPDKKMIIPRPELGYPK